MALKVADYYNSSQPNDWHAHAMAVDDDHAYIGCVSARANGATAYICKINFSDLSTEAQCKFTMDTNNIAIQGLVYYDGYLYANMTRIENHDSCFVRISAGGLGTISYQRYLPYTIFGGLGITGQGMCQGLDLDHNSVIYTLNNTELQADGYITRYQTNATLSFVPGKATFHMSDGNFFFDSLIHSAASGASAHDVYIGGLKGTTARKRASFIRLKPVKSGSDNVLSFSAQLEIRTGNEVWMGGIGSGSAIWQIYPDPSDATYIWGVGFVPKSAGSDYADVLLIKFGVGTTSMSVARAFIIRDTSMTSMRGCGLVVTADYVYICTTFIPHSGLGTTEYDPTITHRGLYMRISKTWLNGTWTLGSMKLFTDSASNQARAVGRASNGQTGHAFMRVDVSDTTNYLWVSGHSSAFGIKTKWANILCRYERDMSALSGNLYNDDASIVDQEEKNNIEVTYVNNGYGITVDQIYGTLSTITTDPAVSTYITRAAVTNTKTVQDIEHGANILWLKPVGSGTYMTGTDKATNCLNPASDTHHWNVLDEDPPVTIKTGGDFVGEYHSGNPFKYDLYVHDNSSFTTDGRITKFEWDGYFGMAGVARSEVNFGEAWRIGDSGTLASRPSTAASTTPTDATEMIDDVTSLAGIPAGISWTNLASLQFGPYLRGYIANYTRCYWLRGKVTWVRLVHYDAPIGGAAVLVAKGSIHVTPATDKINTLHKPGKINGIAKASIRRLLYPRVSYWDEPI